MCRAFQSPAARPALPHPKSDNGLSPLLGAGVVIKVGVYGSTAVVYDNSVLGYNDCDV